MSRADTHQVQFREGGEWRQRRQRGSRHLERRLQLPQMCDLRQVGMQICLGGLQAVGTQSDARGETARLGYAWHITN